MEKCREYMEAFSPFSQYIISFSIGILLSPLSWGFIYYILFIIVYEVIVYAICCDSWDYTTRIGIIMLSIVGWLIGRELTGKNVV